MKLVYFNSFFLLWLFLNTACTNLSPEQEFAKGVQKLSSKDFEGAINSFDKVIKIRPNFSDAFYYRGIAKNELLGPEGYNKEEIDEDLKKGISESSTDTIKLFKRASLSIQHQNYRQAFKDYYRITAIDKRNIMSYKLRIINAPVLRSLYDYSEYDRLKDLNSIIELVPNDQKAYDERITIYYRQSNFEGAIEDITKLISLNKDPIEVARLYGQRGQFKSWLGYKYNDVNFYKDALLDFELYLKEFRRGDSDISDQAIDACKEAIGVQ